MVQSAIRRIVDTDLVKRLAREASLAQVATVVCMAYDVKDRASRAEAATVESRRTIRPARFQSLIGSETMSFILHQHCILVQAVLVLTCITTARGLAAEKKASAPDEAAEQAAKKMAGEIYGGRFALAKTAADKTALAAEMIDAALKVRDGSPGQFVLLRIARDIALGAGDAPTALQAVGELVQRFEVPAATLAAETLLGAAQQASMTAEPWQRRRAA